MPRLGQVLTHAQMCYAEGGKFLQKGMHFKKTRPSVLLMSRRRNAPYRDMIQDDGSVLIYEGHDIRPDPNGPDPKSVDQPIEHEDGRPTDNGKFFHAAKAVSSGLEPLRVHVYEKIRPDVWVFNGAFVLQDAWMESDDRRQVCRFKLRLVDEIDDEHVVLSHDRLIPSIVKAEVWQRDKGKCTRCGADENLHFDHIIPFSKGGTSLLASNIQLLCAAHNLEKRDHIM